MATHDFKSTTWQAFLTEKGAQIAADNSVSWPQARQSAAAASMIPLLHRSQILVSGADAELFLQGQLSCDVRKLSGQRAQLCSYNSAKGRMLAVLLAWRTADGYLLETETELIEPLIKRLRMFVLRAKVSIELQPCAILGWLGALPDPWQADDQDFVVTGLDEMQAVGWPAPASPRYSLSGPAAAVAQLCDSHQTLAAWGATQQWRAADIAAGLPTVFAGTQDHFVAQMANLDHWGGLAFDKGCYTGQEVIARLHYRGGIKRRMYSGAADITGLQPGADVYANGESQAVGEVANVAQMEGRSLVSVVLKLAAADKPLRLSTPDGAELQLEPQTI